MNASALNIASSAQAGPHGHGLVGAAVASAQATGPLAGFEALLAALFPQADPTTVAAAAGAGAPSLPVSPTTKPEKADGKDKPAAPTDPATADAAKGAEPAVGDAAAALVASLAAAPGDTTPAAGPTTAAPAETPEDGAPPAWGREKAQPGPAQPALTNANPHARLAEKVAAAAESPEAPPANAAVEPDSEVALAETPGIETATKAETKAPATPQAPPPDASAKADPPAWGRDKPQGTPAAPALETANPKAELAQKAAPTQPDAPPPTVPPVDPSVQSPPPALASVTARPEPAPPPAPAGRATKSERAKALADASPSTDARPVDNPNKPQAAKPADAAARPAAPDIEPADGKPDHVKADADAPDATPQAEFRAASSATAAAATTSHAVRGAPETVANLAAQIIKKLEGRSTRFDLELDPAGLGKVDVRVEIGAHGRVTAAMTCDNPQAAAELRSRASELQRALEQAGFDLSGGLSFDVAGDRGQRQGQAWQDQDGGNSGGAFRGQAFRAALDTAGDADAGALTLRRGVRTGLDLRI